MSEIEEFFDDCDEPFCNGCGLLWEECECGSRDFEPDPWAHDLEFCGTPDCPGCYAASYKPRRCDKCGETFNWCRCARERKEG